MYAKVEKKAVVVKEVREGGREGGSEREREREREREEGGGCQGGECLCVRERERERERGEIAKKKAVVVKGVFPCLMHCACVCLSVSMCVYSHTHTSFYYTPIGVLL